MLTVNTRVTVDHSHLITLQLPKDLPKGEYEVVVVLDQAPEKKKKLWSMKLKGKVKDKNIKRDQLYGDNYR
jgi:hypothetical protein